MPRNVESFPVRLRRLRLGKDLSQRELAAQAGVSHVAYLQIEKGRAEPRLGNLRRLAAALGLSVGELVEG